MRIGIFGGTFSPIHNGHVKAALCFMEKMKLDKLYVIPDHIPPHKVISSSDDPNIRFEMTKLAFCGIDKVEVSDIELLRKGKSFTVDTLPAFADEGELFLLCGTDMFLSFDTWHRFEDIFKLCTLVLIPRDFPDEKTREEIEMKNRIYKEIYGAKTEIIDATPFPISSTEICRMIKNGEDYSMYVPKKIHDFIEERGLYR